MIKNVLGMRKPGVILKIITKSFSSASNKSGFDPYLIMDLNRKADWKEIKKQYFKLAKLYHPDIAKNDEVRIMQSTL